MGSVGKLAQSTLANYDKRFQKDITATGNYYHQTFPEIQEITRITTNDGIDSVANMNGLGRLEINSKFLNDYDSTIERLKGLHEDGYLAGDGTSFRSIVNHEMAHNLDLQFSQVIMSHAPQTVEPPTKMPTEAWAQAYSKALGVPLKVGDMATTIPSIDSQTKFFQVGDKSFSYSELSGKSISAIVVPMAIERIQANWQALGFKTQPTSQQLIQQLSGYAGSCRGNSQHLETFAEAFSNHLSYGSNANVLAQEIVRLTKQAYKSATASKKNGVMDFYKKLM